MRWPAEMGGEQTPTEPGVKGQVFELEDDTDNPKTSICCLQGCVAASVVGFAFFVALPTGIILIVLSTTKSDTALLAVGCVLVTLPVVILVVVIVLCLNQKQLCCNKRRTQTSGHRQHPKPVQVVRTTSASGESPV
ncbi:hypothetical protein BsWGS_12108 [Bradybaena similaris]